MKTDTNFRDTELEWFPEVPTDWKLKKLKYNTYVKARVGWHGLKSDEFYYDGEGAYCITGTDFRNKIIDWDTCYKVPFERYDEDPYIQLKENDLLITKDGTIGKVALVKNLIGKATLNSGVFVVRPVNNDYLSEFLYWVLQSKVMTEFIDFTSRGSTIVHLYQDTFVNMIIPLPNYDYQQKIISFLDEKTAQIDTIISKKQKLIACLKEERITIINQAVTKGIDPNVEMKPSGIEWLGDIPKHWEVKRISYIAKVVRGASPRPAGDPKFFNGDFCPWLTVAELTKDENKFLTHVSTYLTEEGMKQSRYIEPETLLMSNSGATLGVPKVLKIGGCINDGSVAFFDINSTINRDFLYYYLKSMTKNLREWVSGYGQPNLNTEIVKSLKLPVPPLKEQIEIVNCIETQSQKIEATIIKVQQEIELIKEYKTSLINEVVTGKIILN